jgi:hypothetical protein
MGCLLAESPGPERKEWQSLSDIIRIEQERNGHGAPDHNRRVKEARREERDKTREVACEAVMPA